MIFQRNVKEDKRWKMLKALVVRFRIQLLPHKCFTNPRFCIYFAYVFRPRSRSLRKDDFELLKIGTSYLVLHIAKPWNGFASTDFNPFLEHLVNVWAWQSTEETTGDVLFAKENMGAGKEVKIETKALERREHSSLKKSLFVTMEPKDRYVREVSRWKLIFVLKSLLTKFCYYIT